MKSCNACDDRDGPRYAVRFQSPTAANTSKGAVTETFATQFTRHCNVLPIGGSGDDDPVGPAAKGVVKYQLKCNRDPETATVTGKWRAHVPQLGLTLNLKSQGAIEGRKLKFTGVHVV